MQQELIKVMSQNADQKSYWFKPFFIDRNRFYNENFYAENIRYLGTTDAGDME